MTTVSPFIAHSNAILNGFFDILLIFGVIIVVGIVRVVVDIEWRSAVHVVSTPGVTPYSVRGMGTLVVNAQMGRRFGRNRFTVLIHIHVRRWPILKWVVGAFVVVVVVVVLTVFWVVIIDIGMVMLLVGWEVVIHGVVALKGRESGERGNRADGRQRIVMRRGIILVVGSRIRWWRKTGILKSLLQIGL